MEFVGKAAFVGSGMVPGAAEILQFLDQANSDDKIEVAAADFRAMLPRKSIEMNNGTILLETPKGRIAIPFHALHWLRIEPALGSNSHQT